MYEIIDNLPIDYDFQTKTKKELKLYGKWFEENKDKRLKLLISFIKDSKDFENWKADYSPESLKILGKWLELNIETEKLSKEHYIVKRKAVPDYIDIEDWDLTLKTRSLLVDSAIYAGEVLIKNNPYLRWEQYFSRIKNDNDHGHMVLKGNIEINPVWNFYIIGMGVIRGSENSNSIYDLYKVWLEDL